MAKATSEQKYVQITTLTLGPKERQFLIDWLEWRAASSRVYANDPYAASILAALKGV